MEPLLDGFKTAIMVFRVKGHNLLDYHSNRFDRDFVDFNVRSVAARTHCYPRRGRVHAREPPRLYTTTWCPPLPELTRSWCHPHFPTVTVNSG